MRGLSWYKRDPIAFLDDVQGMGPELIGAYAVIMDLVHARAGETPRDDRHLAGLLGCSIRKARALTDTLAARGKIEIRGEFIVNSDVLQAEKQRRNQRESDAKPTRNDAEIAPAPNKNNSLRPPREEKDIEKNTPLRPPKGKAAKKGLIKYPEEFEQLWAAYPDRPNQSKAKAFEAFDKFDDERKAGAVLAASAFADDCREAGTEPRFIPHCSTWLNERRFDEFVEYDDDGEAEGTAEAGHADGPSGPPPGDGLADAGHVRGRDDEVQPEPQSPPSPAMGRSSKRCASASGMGGVLRSESAAPETEGGSFVARSSWDALRAELRCAAEVAKRDDGPAGRRPTPTDRSHYH